MVTDIEIANIHNARGRIYAFLSNVYLNQPDNDFYKMLSEILPQLKEFAAYNEDINNGVTLLDKFLKEKASLKGKDVDEFELECMRKYTSIMCLPNVAPQEESFYTSKDHLLNQESHDEMVALLNKYQLVLDKKYGLYYDHISVEFKFMSYLAYLSAEKVSDSTLYTGLLNEQLDFYTNHFDKWVEEFFNKVLFACGEDELLYRSLVYIARGYLYEDKNLLQQLLSDNQ